MNNLSYKGYIGSVEYSSEDHCLFGKVQGLFGDVISYEGESVTELENDFREAIDSYIEICKQKGITPKKTFRGTFNVRITPELHRKAYNIAERKGITLNSLVSSAIKQYTDEDKGESYIIQRGQPYWISNLNYTNCEQPC